MRHRLRATLAWEGFAPLRDGLWLAPGEVDMVAALEPLRDVLPPNSVTAFRAEDIPAYPVSRSVREAWDIAAIRAEHERFLDTWSEVGARDGTAGALPALVCLVADWIALLRADPRLPSEFMGPAWPAERAVATYRARRSELGVEAEREFAAMIGRSARRGTRRRAPLTFRTLEPAVGPFLSRRIAAGGRVCEPCPRRCAAARRRRRRSSGSCSARSCRPGALGGMPCPPRLRPSA